MSAIKTSFDQLTELIKRLTVQYQSELPSNATDKDKAKAQLDAHKEALRLMEKGESFLEFKDMKDEDIRTHLLALIEAQEKLYKWLETEASPLEEKKGTGTMFKAGLTEQEVSQLKFIKTTTELVNKMVEKMCLFSEKINSDVQSYDKWSSFKKRKHTSGCTCITSCCNFNCPCFKKGVVCVGCDCFLCKNKP